jgi:peptidoglycan/xylan/chitin deacetylase (PgdA/CDA1 family)
MFLTDDLQAAIAQGHELGCHTFHHCHAWNTTPRLFEANIIENRQALAHLVPGASFQTLSYPIGVPRAQTKKRASEHFACCRGGGQTFNIRRTDLNFLSAYFLEKNRDHPDAIKRVIDQTCREGGWLIFATHDISDTPTQWGCTPSFFEDIVRYSSNSGAKIMPVFQAYKALCDGSPS